MTVAATAKVDLKEGETLDGLVEYMTYGLCENYEEFVKQDLLPEGLARDRKLKRNISKDAVLTYDDIALPENRLSDHLGKEQKELFN